MSLHISSLAPAVVVETPAARVAVTPMVGRISLRARGDLAAFDGAVGIALPRQIGICAKSGNREAICLGPDEWTLLVPMDEVDTVQDGLAAIYGDRPHSMTEVTGREVTFAISGPRASELLTIGCPRDITTIKVGQGRRTVFDGVTVVIWCDAPDTYRMDVWNSFASFVAHTLETGAKELAAEAA